VYDAAIPVLAAELKITGRQTDRQTTDDFPLHQLHATA